MKAEKHYFPHAGESTTFGINYTDNKYTHLPTVNIPPTMNYLL